MCENSKRFLTPEIVSEYITFKSQDKNHTYKNDNSMFAKQYEGVAYLWNLLQEKSIALLADEVGTGKTYQALGVLITLLKLKPDAKCLIIAPRYQVAVNWIGEYNNFIKMHYKLDDDQIKSSITDSAIPSIQYCQNLEEVVSKYELAQIFVAKTTMFSNLNLSNYQGDLKLEKAFEIGREYNRCLKNRKYDLLIIDEAHYYRNFDGDSLRVNAAKGFFGTRGERDKLKNDETGIAPKVLLLTATPNFSKIENIKNLFRYFDYLDIKVDGIPIKDCNDYERILKEFALRRFRRLENKTKYSYRCEEAVDSSFEKDINSEIFFAVYQKRLVRKILRTKKEKESAEKGKYQVSSNRLLFGYLEGCEMLNINPDNKSGKPEGNQDDNNENHGKDYTHGIDHSVLKEVVSKYNDIFGKPPSHPKYDRIVDEIIQKEKSALFGNKETEKTLIFVRRIPSVHELTARLLNEYDKLLFEKLKKVLGRKELGDNLPKSREELDNRVKKIKNINDENLDETPKSEKNKGKDNRRNKSAVNCVLLDYFVRKRDTDSSTEGSKFRNRLLRPDSPYSMLFELPPKKDNLSKPYTFEEVLKNNQNRTNYLETARKTRYGEYKTLNYQQKNKKNSGDTKQNDDEKFETLWTIFFRQLGEKSEEVEIIKSFSEHEWEGLGQFTKKALIFASDAIIELFGWHLLSENNNYTSYVEKVKSNFANSRVFVLMREAVKHFKYIYQKVFGFDEESLPSEEFTIFENAVPVYGFHGSTKNKSIISLFNTPFFPNHIIATSVLQEGVNLHYYCDTVYHYGIAWTQGANEQRNGRIDRLLGKVHRKVKQCGDAQKGSMNIYYPVLKNSIDELQVSQFIINKRKSEDLIDRCLKESEKEEIGNEFRPDWEIFLRKPALSDVRDDPYPADFKKVESNLICTSYFSNTSKLKARDIVNTITEYFKEYFNKNSTIQCFAEDKTITEIKLKVKKLWNEKNPTSELFYLKAEISSEKHNKPRNQPAKICCGYLPLPAVDVSEKRNFNFYLKITSPVAEKDKREEFIKKLKDIETLMSKYPLARIEIDRDKKGYEYLSCCSYVLVVFDDKGNLFLNENELSNAVAQAIYAGDELEKKLYKEDKADFKNKDKQPQDNNKNNEKKHLHLTNDRGDDISEGWKIDGSYVFKSASITLKGEEKKDNERIFDILEVLSKYPFISLELDNNKVKIKLSYLKTNFQKEEQKVLARWFQAVKVLVFHDLKEEELLKK